MATLSPTPQPNPARIFDTLNAYQQTAALRAAIDLDIFTTVGEGYTSATALAEKCGASARGARILCDYLVIDGFLTKQEANYGLTPESALFLDRRSSAYLGCVSKFLGSPGLVDGFKDLAGAVRRGGTTMSQEGTVSDNNPIWVEFARSMPPLVAAAADDIARTLHADSDRPIRVLDMAAGHGLFGIAIAKLNPNAQVVAQDWENVLKVARDNAKKARVEDRFTTLPGSAFDADLGGDYDVILLTNFLHHFSPKKNETLLKKVRAALKPGGRAAALEFVPNEDRISPPLPAKFSMMMLGSTAEGDAYTYRELERMFLNADFSRCELHPVANSLQQLVIARA
jgi:ubiquinone/menaquinone biosynthesis C-methylase UbiE